MFVFLFVRSLCSLCFHGLGASHRAPWTAKIRKKTHTGFSRALTDGSAMLMCSSKGETAVHGFHCPCDMAGRMRKVMAWPWVALTSAVRGFWDASFPRSGSNGNGVANWPRDMAVRMPWAGVCVPLALSLHYFQCNRIMFNLFFINYCIS